MPASARLQSARFGKVLVGIRENEPRMEALGYATPLHKTAAFALSAGLAGLAGALYATHAGFVAPSLGGVLFSTEVVVWVAVAGRDSLLAAFLGGLLVPSLSNYLYQISPSLWQLFMGGLFIAAITLFRGGVAELSRPAGVTMEQGAMSVLLETQGLGKRFSGLVANADIDFRLERGEIRSVIGPNGAGKTTFISMISGHLAPSSGRIAYKGRDITRLPVVSRARLGIGRKFQTPSLFDNLTAYANVELATLRARAPRGRIGEVLALVRLEPQARTPARHLSHGQRQWLEMRCCSPTGPSWSCSMSPAGMTAEETHATGQLIRDLAEPASLDHRDRARHQLRARPRSTRDRAPSRPHPDRGAVQAVAEDPRVRDVYLGTG